MINNKYQKGVENLPPRDTTNQPLPILVLVYNLLDNKEPAIEKQLNYSDFDDRKWLGRITYWAITNKHYVETIAVSDAKAPTE